MIGPGRPAWPGRLLVLVSWIALVTGLVLARGAAADDAPPAPLLPATLVLARTDPPPVLEIEAVADGDARLVLALALADLERDGDEIARRIADGDLDLRVTLAIDADEGPDPDDLAIAGVDLAVTGSLHRDALPLLLVAERALPVRAGRTYRLAAELEGADAPWLATFRPALLVEPRRQAPAFRRRDPWPGALTLLGALGVLVHLYVALGRLIVPERPPLPRGDPAAGNIEPTGAVR